MKFILLLAVSTYSCSYDFCWSLYNALVYTEFALEERWEFGPYNPDLEMLKACEGIKDGCVLIAKDE